MRTAHSLIAASLGLALAASANAGVITMNNPNGGGNTWREGSGWSGGAFRATVVSGFNGVTGGPGGSSDSFLTFCLEYTEHFEMGNTYNTIISDRAMNGGNDDDNNGAGDPISAVTKAIYAEFRRGGSNSFGISGLNIGAGGDLSNLTRAVQEAIWFEEDERDTLPSGLATTVYNWGVNVGATNGIGDNVRVLQLWNPDGSRAQDQLTLIPLPTAGAAGLMVLGLGAARRRRVTV